MSKYLISKLGGGVVMVMVIKVLHLVDALVEVTMSGFLVEYIWCFVVVPVGLVYPLDY